MDDLLKQIAAKQAHIQQQLVGLQAAKTQLDGEAAMLDAVVKALTPAPFVPSTYEGPDLRVQRVESQFPALAPVDRSGDCGYAVSHEEAAQAAEAAKAADVAPSEEVIQESTPVAAPEADTASAGDSAGEHSDNRQALSAAFAAKLVNGKGEAVELPAGSLDDETGVLADGQTPQLADEPAEA
jgi:hypothetical protein